MLLPSLATVRRALLVHFAKVTTPELLRLSCTGSGLVRRISKLPKCGGGSTM